MREITICAKCGSKDIEYLGCGKCYCNDCKSNQNAVDKFVSSPYERTRASVYVSGNKWEIENFNVTH